MTSKTCFKCGVKKSLSDFYKHQEMADGHLNKCKECTKKDAHDHRHGAGRKRILEYDRARAVRPDRKDKSREIIEKWRREHPERKAAHNKLARAIKSGKVKPWAVCSMPCCDKKPEAHHPDYDRPLDVVWLCREHHMQAHAIAKHSPPSAGFSLAGLA